MRAKTVLVLIALAAVAAAYVAGAWPERQARAAADERAEALQARLADAEARLRAGEILGRVLVLKEVAMRQNYGQARDLASSFFDAVRQEAVRSTRPDLTAALNELLAMRDGITAALATADPAVVDRLHQMELRLRGALGYAPAP